MTHEVKTIDMTPTDEAYANIALMFAQNVRGDLNKRRQADAMFLIGGIVRTAAYFAAKGDAENLNKILAYVEGDEHKPVTAGEDF